MTLDVASDYAISLASIRAAATRIDGLAHRTPVLTCGSLDAAASTAAGRPIHLFFKCENLQKIGAFKYRGALNAVKKALETAEDGDTQRTFVTHSSGNHAQAVALAARDAGCKAVIVMPENAPVVKVNAVRGYGAQVVFSDAMPASREAVAEEWVQKTGGHFIHPSNDVDVMSGQGTAALELLDQVDAALDAVVVPVGGGGLCSGVTIAIKSVDPSIKVFAVEPEGAADAHASFTAKQLLGHATPPATIADGLRSTLGDNNFPVIRDLVDAVVLVPDSDIVATMKLMWERMKLVVEPSGAVSTAGVLANKLPLDVFPTTKETVNVGIIISGGNVDLDHLPWATP